MGFVSFFVGVYYYILSVFSFIYILNYPVIRWISGKFSKQKINPADPFSAIVAPYKHVQEKKRPMYATAALSAAVVKDNTNTSSNAALVVPGLVSEVVEEGVPSSSSPVPFNLSLPLSAFPFVTDPNYNHNQPIIPFIQKSLIANDGAVINYYILYPNNPRTMVFANGLGVKSSFQSFAPLLKQYAGTDGDWSFITWDYRGLFHPNSLYPPNHLSPHYHCEDLAEILAEENIQKIDCMVGYSFGGQIALQMALSYPNKVGKLFLVNSTYGKIFDSIYQPFFRVPYASDVIQTIINVLVAYPLLVKIGLFFYKPLAKVFSFFYNIYFGSPYFRSMIGTGYLSQYFTQYLVGNYHSYIDVINYFQLLQEFDNHSVAHLLKFIHQPTMIVAGLLDSFIPAYQSFEIAAHIPNSKLMIAPAAGHGVLLESPDRSLVAVKELIEADHDWMKKYTGPTEEEKKKILKGVVKEVVEKIEQKNETVIDASTAATTASTSGAAGKKNKKNKQNNQQNNNKAKVHAVDKEGDALGESWTDVSTSGK